MKTKFRVVPEFSKEIQPGTLGMSPLHLGSQSSWVYSYQGKFGMVHYTVIAKVQKFLGMS